MHPILHNLLQTLLPSTCACCGDVLMAGEKQLCINCLADLTATRYTAHTDNRTERLLGARFVFANASSIFFFRQGNTVQKVVHAMKFSGNSDLCLLMGRQMGLELLASGRFDNVDLLVPVPLHWRRRLHRGYNQSELLCRGIAQVMPREVNTRALQRHRYTHQQSLQASADRQANVQDAFSLRHPDDLAGHHILLVDDVLTTGATISSCCQPLADVPGLTVSIATFCIAGH